MAIRETRIKRRGTCSDMQNTLDYNLLEKGHTCTFEHAHWEILGCNMTLSLLALYHPPPSPKLQHTISEFVTEFVDFLADKLNKYTGRLLHSQKW